MVVEQPRSQGFSLEGKSPGNEVGRREVASAEVAPTSFPGLFSLKLGKGKALQTRFESRPKTGKRLWKREGVRVRGRSTAIRPGF